MKLKRLTREANRTPFDCFVYCRSGDVFEAFCWQECPLRDRLNVGEKPIDLAAPPFDNLGVWIARHPEVPRTRVTRQKASFLTLLSDHLCPLTLT